jgi:CRP-like cAMP-binding protein
VREYFETIAKTPLFAGISQDDFPALLNCVAGKLKTYAKQSSIFFAGNPATHVGILLDGTAQVVRDDLFGNRSILTTLGEEDIFGETFACADIPTLPVSVIAITSCIVLLIDYRKIIRTCTSSCEFHNLLIQNMMQILARKNLLLNGKIEVLSARSTREKLWVYLMSQADRAQSPKFRIPFNRQELADYISVDRSAMSAELGKMKIDGLLTFHKNEFTLFTDKK